MSALAIMEICLCLAAVALMTVTCRQLIRAADAAQAMEEAERKYREAFRYVVSQLETKPERSAEPRGDREKGSLLDEGIENLLRYDGTPQTKEE